MVIKENLSEIMKNNFIVNYLKTEVHNEEKMNHIFDHEKELNTFIFNSLTNKLDLTVTNILNLYRLGFSFSEIGILKDITKMGVKYIICSNINEDNYITLKKEHNINRKNLKNKILNIEIFLKLTDDNYEDVRKELGYTESYFKIFILKLKKYNQEVNYIND